MNVEHTITQSHEHGKVTENRRSFKPRHSTARASLYGFSQA